MIKPSKISAVHRNGMTEVRLLMSQDMETGLRKDNAGSLIPAWHITEVDVACQGRSVFKAQFGSAVSKNPHLVFRFQGGAKGDVISVSWIDNRGNTRRDEGSIS